MSVHAESHPLAGKTVKVSMTDHSQVSQGVSDYRVEDWWDKLTGGSWMTAQGNPAALIYALRASKAGLPLNDDVLYGKVDAFGHLVHISEIVSEA